MRIVHAGIRFDAPGGAETHIKALTTRLADRGHDVAVHASDLYSERPWQVMEDPSSEVDGVRVERHRVYKDLLPGLRYPVMPSMIQGLLDEDADIYHAHSHRYFQVRATQLVADALGKPFVVTPHYHPPQEDLPWWKQGLAGLADVRSARAVYDRAARVCVVTEREVDLMGAMLDGADCTVVPNGIDAPTWRDRVEPAGDDWEAPVWLYAGRLAENKGLDHLVDAFARFRDETGSGTLVVTGEDWGQGDMLADRAKQRGVADHVRVLGFVDFQRYRAVHERADIFVLPSEWEAFGIVLLEAWASGTPVVATRVGGVPSVVDDGRDGRLVEYGDPGALANAVADVVADPDDAEAMARRGQKKVFERFTWEQATDRLEEVYEEVVA